MNWDAVGTIAEVVGAVAVVITLIYLTVQLRQNTKAMKSATIDSLNTAMVSNIELFLNNNEILDLMNEANSGRPLSEDDETRYYYLLLMLTRRFEGFYFQRTLGFVDPAMTAGYEHSILSIIGRNSNWWQRAKKVFSPDFVAHVEETIKNEIPEAVHPGFENFRDDAEPEKQ